MVSFQEEPKRNLDFLKNFVAFDDSISKVDMLLAADAQTSGGLLITLPHDQAIQYVSKLKQYSKIIGRIIPKEKKMILVK